MAEKKSSDGESSATNECQECGKPTVNPRFCNRSCAAKFNNRKSPKRVPEGKCKTCDSAIPSNRTYCPSCLQKQKQAAADALQRPRVWINQRMVFSFSCQPLSLSDSIGNFLDVFEAIAGQSPPYLRPDDWRRHLDFVQILRGFHSTLYRPGLQRDDVAVVDIPLEQLTYTLGDWVESAVFQQSSHPLAATFALDTATVLHSHAFGRHCDSHNKKAFELQVVVSGESRRDEIAGQRLKKEITECTISGMHVIARLPESAKASVFREPIGCESRDVCFLPFRCHQSSSWNEEYELVIESDVPEFNLSSDFEFLGQFVIASNDAVPKGFREWWSYEPTFASPNSHEGHIARGHLPISWITHCGYDSFQLDSMTPVPTRWQSFEGILANNSTVERSEG